MTQTQDINTAAHPPARITTLQELTQGVFRAASLQLVINSALAEQQARHEAAKAAFDEATRGLEEEKAALLAGIHSYCEHNKDALFPVAKNGARRKTFAVLQHKLQYRCSTSLRAPDDITTRIRHALSDARAALDAPGLSGTDELALKAQIRALENLLRVREELNKEAAKRLAETAPELCRALGITQETSENFNLAFAFTPDA